MSDVSEIISKWPSAEAFSDDLGLKYRSHGRVMKVRGRIPEARWPDVIAAAERRGIEGVTRELLEAAHGRSESAQ
jgi:hypothetical protein